MASYVKYNSGTEALAEAINSGSDTWRLILSNTAPDAADAAQADAAELSTSGGYTVNGVACTITSSVQTGGVYKLILAAPVSPTWTASGGGFTFRYVILWNQTQDKLVAYWDYGASVVLSGANGDTFTPTLDASGGTFTLT
jgi:hypothetical protein